MTYIMGRATNLVALVIALPSMLPKLQKLPAILYY